MASSILLSDNGVSSGSAGIKTTGGNDGVLLLQTTTSGGTATTAVTVDNAQNVGVGVTPSASSVTTLEMTNGFVVTKGDVTYGGYLAGNAYYNSGWKYKTSNPAIAYALAGGGGQHQWFTAASGTAGNAITFTQAMTLDASGRLLLNATSVPSAFAAALQYIEGSTSTYNLLTIKDTGTSYSTGNYYALFGNSTNGTAGSIAHNAAGTVAFQTSSDQRLKENIVDAPAALDKINSIKVRSYDWKEDQLHVDYGFIAQELYQLVPEAVGKGDEEQELVDARGTWQVEYGRLTPLLVKAIQEQQALITSLTERITALEAK